MAIELLLEIETHTKKKVLMCTLDRELFRVEYE